MLKTQWLSFSVESFACLSANKNEWIPAKSCENVAISDGDSLPFHHKKEKKFEGHTLPSPHKFLLKSTPGSFVQTWQDNASYTSSFNSVIYCFLWPTAHFPIPILFYFDANRDLPWLCPGSFSSVRLMLSICHNKFAPIPSCENMHLFPFELSFLCSPFPWLSLTVVYVSSFDFASCVFFDCTCIFSRLSWHDYFARRALFVGDRPRYSIPCVCARVSIPIWCSIGQRLISTG